MRPIFLLLVAAFAPALVGAAAAPTTVKLWPGTPPGDESVTLAPEADLTKDTDTLIAGRRIIKLGNVATPLLEVHQPPKDKANGSAVIVCPGGGHSILAWDLEGTEVATWLNSLGVTAIVLKYRVPTRTPAGNRWQAALQDAQRALSVTRARGKDWGIDSDRIGILGFSAGGEAAGLASLMYQERTYPQVDAADQVSCRPDFTLLIYAGGFYDAETQRLRPHVVVPTDAPPFFMAHAWNDRVPVQNPLVLGTALKAEQIPVAMHLYPTGGHGYGLRPTDEPVTTWPARAAEWLRTSGFLARRQ